MFGESHIHCFINVHCYEYTESKTGSAVDTVWEVTERGAENSFVIAAGT